MHEPESLMGVLGLLLISLLGVVAIVRRFAPQLGQRFHRAGRLKHLGCLSLTPQCSVALVRIGREILVLGLTPQAVTLLTKTHESDAKDEEHKGVATMGPESGTADLQRFSLEETEATL